MLTEVAIEYPRMSYYQGMNCIGGYFINYIDDYEKAKIIFGFLLHKGLEKYFLNNFARL